MTALEQNSFYWLVPTKEQPYVELNSRQALQYDFVQCFDGRFSYDIWIYADFEKNTHIGFFLDGQVVYEAMRMQSGSARWRLLGSFQAVKGEHRIVLTGIDEACRLDGILITRMSDYIHDGTADLHRQAILNGKDVYALLEESGLLEAKRETEEEKAERKKRLDRYGFLEREDQDASEGRCRCGVPMGGIGAGKIELDKEGVLTAITINNNCEVPIYKTRGSFFAARVRQGKRVQASLLQTTDVSGNGFPVLDEIDFTGRFPHAQLQYKKNGFPVKLSMDAFSALVPYDEKNSSLPTAIYTITAENPGEEEAELSVLFSFENLIGTGGSMAYETKNPDMKHDFIMNSWNPGFVWCDRRTNYETAGQLPEGNAIYFGTKEDHGDPASCGDYTMLCAAEDMTVSRRLGWDVFTDGKDLWNTFEKTGELEDRTAKAGTDDACMVSGTGADDACTTCKTGSDDVYTAAAMAVKGVLAAREKKQITFILAWNMPQYPDVSGKNMGVYYSNFFSSSKEIASYAAQKKDWLYQETIAFERMLKASSLPDWLSDKLINDRFPIYSCSWFAKDGKFAINEAPAGMMGCLGTMDQRLACNVLYTDFYPKLDQTELFLFQKCQGEDGSISHDLGFGEFAEGKRPGTWSDLCSSFILQIYKHYLYTGDRVFLEKMYASVKKAVQYQISIDLDQNGIPDVGAGHGTTYDTYHWYGTSAFVASLWVTELAVCRKLAEIFEDEAFGQLCSAYQKQACESMEKELWTKKDYGGYYKNYFDRTGGRESENCFIAQLAGEWFASLVDVESGLPQDKTKEALSTIAKRNVELAGMRLMNDETTPEGDFYGYGYTFVQYDEVYYGCLAVYQDLVENGLDVFRRVNDCTRTLAWNVGLTYHTDGRFCGLPYYMTNPASLFLLDALSGWLPDVAAGKLKLFPHIDREKLSIPLFSPKLWLKLDYETQKDRVVYDLEVVRTVEEAVRFTTLILRADFKAQLVLIDGQSVPFTQDGSRIACKEIAGNAVTGNKITCGTGWNLKAGETHRIEITT